MRTLDKELSEVRVPALADPSEGGLAARRGLARDDPEPRGHVPPAREHVPIADGRHGGGGNERADARNRHEPLALIRVGRPDGQLVGGRLDLPVNGEPALAHAMEDVDQVIEQPALYIAGDRDGVVRGHGVPVPEVVTNRLEVSARLAEMISPRAFDFRGVHLIPGGSHWILQERPEEVSRLLVEFLRGLPKGTERCRLELVPDPG